jgi:hypothetical protein
MLQKYFWEKSDFSMDKEIRFFGKIGFLNDLKVGPPCLELIDNTNFFDY